MKKIFYFIIICFLSLAVYLNYQAEQGQAKFCQIANNVNELKVMLINFYWIVFLILMIITKILPEDSFDYKSNYNKFKSKDKIKITFIDKDKQTVTKRGCIKSINEKKIVFENQDGVYECSSSQVKQLKKCGKNLLLFILISIPVVITILINEVIFLCKHPSYYDNPEVTWYGTVVDDYYEERE